MNSVRVADDHDSSGIVLVPEGANHQMLAKAGRINSLNGTYALGFRRRARQQINDGPAARLIPRRRFRFNEGSRQGNYLRLLFMKPLLKLLGQ